LETVCFVKEGKLKNPEENLLEQGENQQTSQPTYDTGAELNPGWVRGEHSHHCAITTSQGEEMA